MLNNMQAKFHALGREREAVLAKSAGLREKREALRAVVADMERKMAPMTAEIKAIEAPLFEIDMERGALARALNGKTGPRPA